MRDINRIHKICALLEEVWTKYPDFRFWQLLMNINWNFKGDFFFLEDDKVETALIKLKEGGF